MVNQRNVYGQTALMLAAKAGAADVVSFLLSQVGRRKIGAVGVPRAQPTCPRLLSPRLLIVAVD